MKRMGMTELADLPTMIQKHSTALPNQPDIRKMISVPDSEQKDRSDDDWKKMQNIRVIARFRPANKVEKEETIKQKLTDIPPEIVGKIVKLTLPHDQAKSRQSTRRKKNSDRTAYKSSLDHIFGVGTTQRQVFKKVGEPLINAALGGFNATLFAYGQTGSGKTYSMFGANDHGGGNDMEAMGLIPRSFVYLFDRLEYRKSSAQIADEAVNIQMLQIYNGELLDLLNPGSKTRLEIKTDFSGGNGRDGSIYVKGLRKIDISSAREALAVLIEGSKNRIVAGHKLNAHSSRSHMLVMLKIVQKRIDGSSTKSNVNFGGIMYLLFCWLNLLLNGHK